MRHEHPTPVASTTLVTLAAVAFGAGALALGQPKMPYDFASAARGENIYRAYCTTCHGKAGKGDGPLAKELKVAPANLLEIAKRNKDVFPLEDVIRRIDGREPVKGHGSKDMPAWGEAFQITDGSAGAKDKVKDLAHYLWSIQLPAPQ